MDLKRFFATLDISSDVEQRRAKNLARDIATALRAVSYETNPSIRKAAVQLAVMTLHSSGHVLSAEAINRLYDDFSQAGLFVTEAEAISRGNQ